MNQPRRHRSPLGHRYGHAARGFVEVSTLRRGDEFMYGPDYEHRVRILRRLPARISRYGYQLTHIFLVRIVSGPDRVGEEGQAPFGEGGVVKVARHIREDE